MTPKQPTRKKPRIKVRKTVRRPARKTRRVNRAVAGKVPARSRVARRKTPVVARKKTVRSRRGSHRRAAGKKTPARPRSRTGKTAVPSSTSVAADSSPRLFLIARDPRWLYAHWSFSPAERRAWQRRSAGGRLTLRVRQGSPAGALVKEVNLQADADYCFVPVTGGDARFTAELGYQPPRGPWVSVAHSNPVTTPPDTVAADPSVVWATIPIQVPFRQIMETLGKAWAGRCPLLEAVPFRDAAGYDGLPDEAGPETPTEPWTFAQAQELDRLTGGEDIHQRLHRELASLAAADLLPPDATEWPDMPTSPGGGWSGD
jgi:hypothetical protein